MAKSAKWHRESVTSDLAQLVSIKRVLYSAKTPFQKVEILETGPFGLCLLLDGKTQSSTADEYVYHEALVHPAMLAHPHPERVFIAGGGEGATLREVLAHQGVQRAVMVDIDPKVVEACRRFLPEHHQGAFDDPRAELQFTDARAYLHDTEERFDVILLDLADPIEEGPAYLLYTQEFYRLVRQRLNPGGIMVTQSGPAGALLCREVFTAIVHTVGSVFPHVYPYTVEVPAFSGTWGFVLGSAEPLPERSPQEIDRGIAQRVRRPLRLYDGVTHQHLFSL
ncbi:MAG: polyamine aminopropyltransferase, partial [Dehalococcoidia bacterium]